MFYDNFIALCAKNEISPNRVALDLGLSSGTVTWWKKGRQPRGTMLAKIAEYFGVSTGILLGNEREPEGKPRDDQYGKWIPVLGDVAAGVPIEAITDIIDYEQISADMARGGEYFALRIKGESMEPRVRSGDVVIVRCQEDAASGDVVIVSVGGDSATCKRIKKTPEGVLLIPNNPAYEPIFYTRRQVEELPVRVIGKVVELRGKM